MREPTVWQTLFWIPKTFLGIDVFGAGWLLALWLIGCGIYLGWQVRKEGWTPEATSFSVIAAAVAFVIFYLLPGLTDEYGLPIRGFGAMVLLGIVSANALGAWRARQVGVNPDLIYTLSVWLFFAGFGGARLFYVIEYWDHFAAPTWQQTLANLAKVNEGGIVLYGSVLGAVAAFLIFCRVYKIPSLALADIVAPALAIGLAFGRIGCFMNGCCYGAVSDEPWAVEFPAGSPAYARQLERGQIDNLYGLRFGENPHGPPVIKSVAPESLAAQAGIEAGDELKSVAGEPVPTMAAAYEMLLRRRPVRDLEIVTARKPSGVVLDTSLHRSLPVHPTQLYSSLNAALLCLFLWLYYPFRRRDGEVIALLLSIYPVSRFLMEWIRTDEAGALGTAFTISQLVSLVVLAATALLWVYLFLQPAKCAFASAEAGDSSTPSTRQRGEPAVYRQSASR